LHAALSYTRRNLGAVLLILPAALDKRKIEFAMAASPCPSAYLMMHSWVPARLAGVASLPETTAAVVGFWILFVMRGLGG